MPVLKLSCSRGADISDPTEQQILQSLQELDVKDGFIVLCRSDEDFVQAAGTRLEYADSSGQYMAGNGATAPSTIRNVLISCARGRADWKSTIPMWTNITEDLSQESSDYNKSLKGIWGLIFGVIVLAAVLTLNWLWK